MITGQQADDAIRRIVAAMEAENEHAAIAVVDDHGDLIAAYRMDGSRPRHMKVAISKAYTAAVRDQSTADFHDELVRRNMQVASFVDPLFTDTPGGIPVLGGGKQTIAGIGVTGPTKGHDARFAAAGIAAFGADATTKDAGTPR